VKGEDFYRIEAAKFKKQDEEKNSIDRKALIQGLNFRVFGIVDIVNCVMAGRVKCRGGNLLQR
jgi:hypothetical protein